MMTADIEMLDEKFALIQWISTVDDSSVIERIKKSGKRKLKIGGILSPARRKSLLKRG